MRSLMREKTVCKLLTVEKRKGHWQADIFLQDGTKNNLLLWL